MKPKRSESENNKILQSFFWFTKNSKQLFLLLLITHLVFIILFFDSKVHVGGDDSDYLIAGLDFLNGDAFPSWHGMFYPIFLSPVIALAGLNVVVLKVLSVIISLGSFGLTYKAFKGKIPDPVLFFALSIIAGSYAYVVYASTTYSEPLFIFCQSIVFFFTFKLMDVLKTDQRKQFIYILLLSLTVFLLSITRNVGYGAIIAVLTFFLFQKHYRIAAILATCFFSLHGLLKFYKSAFWGVTQAGLEGQFTRIAYKNFYDPTQGSENALGFVIRFWENSNVYLSQHLASSLGLRSLHPLSSWTWLTIVFYLAFLIVLILVSKKNHYLLVVTIYVSIMLLVTFVTQQTHWQQERLVIVYLPLIAILLGFLFYQLVLSKTNSLQIIGKVSLFVVPLLVSAKTINVEKNIWNTLAEVNGRAYAGYSSEWANYAELSKWTGLNIPEKEVVLCRKPGISRVYGKRKFVGISRFHDNVADSADAFLRKRNVSYVILDRLQLPTVNRLLSYYLQKYPLGLTPVISKGTENPSDLFKITRENPANDEEYLKRVSAGKILYPLNTYYFLLEADKHFQRQLYSKAIEGYSAALDLNPSVAEANQILFQRALSNLYLKRPDKSRPDIEKILSTEPTHQNAWLLLANVFEQKGMQPEAKAAFIKSKQP